MALTNTAPVFTVMPGDERGSALLEMTFVIPILLSIGLGVFEFGNAYYKYHLMENAARDAARFGASRVGSVCTDSTLQSEIKAVAQRTGASSGVWTTGWSIAISCTSYNNKANNFAYRGGDTINSIKVTITIPYQSLGFFGFFNLTPPTLKASHEERVIGVR